MTLSKQLSAGNYSNLSRLTGLDRSHIGRVLSGKSGYSVPTLKSIAEAIGVEWTVVLQWIEMRTYESRGFTEGPEGPKERRTT